jgi:hypothetical protein
LVEPTDIIVLSHNRLEYLQATVDALFARTPEPFRLTIVDNASGSDVRTWLAANRGRFERVIPLSTNEHVPGFQHGIEATTSDPFIVTDPDLIVPDVRPSWLARLHDLMDRHPDVGLLGVSIGQPLPPESHDDVEIVDANVGTWFQMIRRGALTERYVKDSSACNAVRQTGYRAGWTPTVRAEHLGAHDASRYPGHIAAKNEVVAERIDRGALSPYPLYYRQLEVIPRAPTLSEIASSAAAIAEIRRAEIPLTSVVELTWTNPSVAAVYDEAVAVDGNAVPPAHVPLANGAAGAVVLVDPPVASIDELCGEAFRIAAKLVVLACDLQTVGGRMSDELAPVGWTGSERPAENAIIRELAHRGDGLPALAASERFTTIEHRDDWLSFFAAGAFASNSARVFIFRREVPLAVPDRVLHDDDLPRRLPEARTLESPRASLPRRAVRRALRLANRIRPRL